jgi:hypothetical protein
VRTVVIELNGKRLFVLNGLPASEHKNRPVYFEVVAQLVEAVKRDPDAVAFGRVSGRWVAAA